MSTPFGEQQYDSDGLPIQNPGHPRPFNQQGHHNQGEVQQHNPFHSPYPNQQPYGAPQPYQHGQMQPHQGYQPVGYVAPKSWVVAAVLAFFLGALGVHNFYLGYTKRGVTQLGLTLFGYITSFLLIGIPIIFGVAVWAFIEFILILVRSGRYRHDANGMQLN